MLALDDVGGLLTDHYGWYVRVPACELYRVSEVNI